MDAGLKDARAYYDFYGSTDETLGQELQSIQFLDSRPDEQTAVVIEHLYTSFQHNAKSAWETLFTGQDFKLADQLNPRSVRDISAHFINAASGKLFAASDAIMISDDDDDDDDGADADADAELAAAIAMSQENRLDLTRVFKDDKFEIMAYGTDTSLAGGVTRAFCRHTAEFYDRNPNGGTNLCAIATVMNYWFSKILDESVYKETIEQINVCGGVIGFVATRGDESHRKNIAALRDSAFDKRGLESAAMKTIIPLIPGGDKAWERWLDEESDLYGFVDTNDDHPQNIKNYLAFLKVAVLYIGNPLTADSFNHFVVVCDLNGETIVLDNVLRDRRYSIMRWDNYCETNGLRGFSNTMTVAEKTKAFVTLTRAFTDVGVSPPAR